MSETCRKCHVPLTWHRMKDPKARPLRGKSASQCLYIPAFRDAAFELREKRREKERELFDLYFGA